MKTHIQFAEDGTITGVVQSGGKAPICERQLTLNGIVDTTGKRVNVETLALEDAPPNDSE